MSAATSTATISPLNRSAFDGRHFTKEYHDFQRLWGEVSFAALGVLNYLRRYSHGYAGHGDSAKATVSEIARVFKTTRPTIIKALDELRARHIISDDGEPGSTRVRTFTILRPDLWLIGEDAPMGDGEGSTCQDSLQADGTCKDALQVPAPTCQPALQVLPSTCQDSLQPSPNKDRGRENKPPEQKPARARVSVSVSVSAREAGEAGEAGRSDGAGDVPAEWQPILDILHQLPRWEASLVSELTLLEDICPIRVGEDYAPGRGPFSPAFVKQRAADYLDFVKTKDREKPSDTNPRRITGFRSWMSNQRNFADWKQYLDRQKRGITAADEQEQRQQKAAAKRQRLQTNANPVTLHQRLMEQEAQRQAMYRQMDRQMDRPMGGRA